MWATHFKFGTQFVQSATKRSKAAITVGGMAHTGTAVTNGNSPPVFLLCKTIFDAGKRKSSTSSYRNQNIKLHNSNAILKNIWWKRKAFNNELHLPHTLLFPEMARRILQPIIKKNVFKLKMIKVISQGNGSLTTNYFDWLDYTCIYT